MIKWLFAVFLVLPNLSKANDLSISKLEKRIDAQIGVFAFSLDGKQMLDHRRQERFPMCSTFKVLLCAHTLSLVDQGKENLNRNIVYGKADLESYSPITSKHVDRGMNVNDLCLAAIQQSDNTAANLLLHAQGGPKGLTKYLKSLGDKDTHLDRMEPQLNVQTSEKDLDTTTPQAMALHLKKFVFGNALSYSSRSTLKEWLLGNTTGERRLKAGIPTTWKIADKTGTCDSGTTHDVGILFPPSGSPIVVAAYIKNSKASLSENEDALAEIARIIVRKFSETSSK